MDILFVLGILAIIGAIALYFVNRGAYRGGATGLAVLGVVLVVLAVLLDGNVRV
jgi:hypothetical protein